MDIIFTLDMVRVLFVKQSRAYLVTFISQRPTQTLQVGSDNSILFVVDFSVPQGSVFEELKFVDYADDFPAVFERHHVDHDNRVDDQQLSAHPSVS